MTISIFIVELLLSITKNTSVWFCLLQLLIRSENAPVIYLTRQCRSGFRFSVFQEVRSCSSESRRKERKHVKSVQNINNNVWEVKRKLLLLLSAPTITKLTPSLSFVPVSSQAYNASICCCLHVLPHNPESPWLGNLGRTRQCFTFHFLWPLIFSC